MDHKGGKFHSLKNRKFVGRPDTRLWLNNISNSGLNKECMWSFGDRSPGYKIGRKLAKCMLSSSMGKLSTTRNHSPGKSHLNILNNWMLNSDIQYKKMHKGYIYLQSQRSFLDSSYIEFHLNIFYIPMHKENISQTVSKGRILFYSQSIKSKRIFNINLLNKLDNGYQ